MVPSIFDVKNVIILSNFDGYPNGLHESLNIATTLFSHYYNTLEEKWLENILLFRGILSKLTGKAIKVIWIYGCETHKFSGSRAPKRRII